MKTDELIEQLAHGVTTVQPLRPPAARLAAWTGAALLILAGMAVSVRMVMGTSAPAVSPLFLLQQAAALATGATAAYGALATTVPGAVTRWRLLLAIAASVWLASLVLGVARDVQLLGTAGVGVETDWPCVGSISVTGAVLAMPLVIMLRRGAGLTPQRTMVLGALAALSLASIAACLTRPHAFTITMVIWHGVTLVMLAALAGWAGRRVLPPPWAG